MNQIHAKLRHFTKKLLFLQQEGIVVEIKMVDQIQAGNMDKVQDFAGDLPGRPPYTFDCYVGLKDQEPTLCDSSWNIEAAMANGLQHASELWESQKRK